MHLGMMHLDGDGGVAQSDAQAYVEFERVVAIGREVQGYKGGGAEEDGEGWMGVGYAESGYEGTHVGGLYARHGLGEGIGERCRETEEEEQLSGSGPVATRRLMARGWSDGAWDAWWREQVAATAEEAAQALESLDRFTFFANGRP